jgi:hypothetical protein
MSGWRCTPVQVPRRAIRLFRLALRLALTQVVHLWQYESLADREPRGDAMEAHPEWQAYRRIALEEDTLADTTLVLVLTAPSSTVPSNSRSPAE